MLSKYFSASELKCRCRRKECDALPIDPKFLQTLDTIREQYGIVMPVTSGVRCYYWNAKVGGFPKSQHLLGRAVDVLIANKKIPKFLTICKMNGITGVGVGDGWVHIDMRSGKNVTWYYGKSATA